MPRKLPKTPDRRHLPLAVEPAQPEAIPCLTCALCCSYIAVAIDAPDSVRSATEILWHLYHDHVSIYRDSEDEWMVQFETRCRHLLSDNRCGIYETRPPICRTYSEETCEVNADEEGMSFYAPDTFLAYLATRSRRIFQLIQKRYMPGPEHLVQRKLGRTREPPTFDARYRALRQRRIVTPR